MKRVTNNCGTRCLIFLALLFSGLAPLCAQSSGEEAAVAILRKVDANQSYSSIQYEGKMEIISGSKSKTKTMLAWSVGSEKAFIEFTNPEDRGVRMLKLGKNLWMYFPKEKDTVKISGALLRQGLMGSDFSYEDAMESDDLLESYAASIVAEETIEGHKSYVLELVARSRDPSYAKRKLWVDADRYIVLKSELFAKSGLLLKVSRTLEVKKLGDRYYSRFSLQALTR
ncbi:MAG: negative regulator of sigma E activity [Spirochaetes bacterium]|nr:MAG: negative regulator of sigma E activity [Spirochaetota bacterium]